MYWHLHVSKRVRTYLQFNPIEDGVKGKGVEIQTRVFTTPIKTQPEISICKNAKSYPGHYYSEDEGNAPVRPAHGAGNEFTLTIIYGHFFHGQGGWGWTSFPVKCLSQGVGGGRLVIPGAGPVPLRPVRDLAPLRFFLRKFALFHSKQGCQP